MAVFYDTGGGDIYAGPTKEAVISAMQDDCSELDLTEIFEVDGNHQMQETNESGYPTGRMISLAEEYGDDDQSYCICTENQ